MFVSFNWLKQYVDLPDSVTPGEVAAKLKLSTVEVEKVEKQGSDLDNIVVGLVKKVSKHPDADKLKVCTVNDGTQDWQVVCGGSNVKEGMKVAFGKIGAKVRWHGEGELVELTKAKIRGVESSGMICASTEIGLGDRFPLKDEKEILDLTSHLPAPFGGTPPRAGGELIGRPLAEVLGLDDIIFEIDNKSLSNRPDLWGHYGMAREVTALFGRRLRDYKIKNFRVGTGLDLSVRVEDKKLCPRYMAVAIGGIKIAPSPDWLRKKLLAVGLRPINNIVDITNYVMMDLGQPMHAFDESKVKSQKSKVTIVVRRAKEGEKFVTLDETEHVLTSENLVIANGDKAIALAGVMGGVESGVGDNTTAIVYESANFDAASIRKTSTRLGLRTDSSARFEKGLDPNLCELALRRAIELTLELCPGAKITSKTIDAKDFHLRQGPIELPLEFLRKKIGMEIDKKEIIKILSNLGFEIKEKKNILSVKIPTWRATKDISIPEDLVEEVARIYGYDNMPASLPAFPIIPPQRNELRMLERKIKEILALEFNFSEVCNYSFVSPELLKRLELPAELFIELSNPVAKDRPFLRRGLWPGLLENAEANLHRFDAVKMFEIGRTFDPESAGPRVSGNSDELLPAQPLCLGTVFAGKGVQAPFYELSEAITGMLERLGCVAALKPSTHESGKFIHRGRQARVLVNGEGVGAITEIAPSFSERLGIDERVAVAEVDLDKLLPLSRDAGQYKSLPVYPEVVRDIAFVVDKKVEHAEVVSEIKKADGLVAGAELFDVYDPSAVRQAHGSGKVLEGKKSLAYHVTYRSDKKTLESADVDAAHAKVGEVLKKKFWAEVRVM